MIANQSYMLRIAKDDDLAVVVPRALIEKVLDHVHETSPSRHYRKSNTLARIRKRFFRKTWKRNVSNSLKYVYHFLSVKIMLLLNGTADCCTSLEEISARCI